MLVASIGGSTLSPPAAPKPVQRPAIHLSFHSESGPSLSVDVDVWLCALDLAVAHGWVPAGTAEPRDGAARAKNDPWSYDRGSGRRVAGEDARELARCLEKALPKVPEDVVPMQGRPFGSDHTRELVQRASGGAAVAEEEALAAAEILSGPPKAEALSLIDFLRQGAFSISAE